MTRREPLASKGRGEKQEEKAEGLGREGKEEVGWAKKR